VYEVGAHRRFLLIWSDWHTFLDAVVFPTLDESLKSPTTWFRLGFAGVTEVTVTDNDIPPDSSEPQMLLFRHVRMTLECVRQLLLFACIYQCWPWSSVRMFGTAQQEESELDVIKATFAVVKLLQEDARPEVQRQPLTYQMDL
jgi:hypothetical protein